MSIENFKDIDNTARYKEDDWAGDKDNIILDYVIEISGRKCEWDYTTFDAVVKKYLDENRFAENLRRRNPAAVDFKTWGKNPWHEPKVEHDAFEEIKKSYTNDDIIIKSAEFNEYDSFKDMQPYKEKTAKIVYSLNVTKALEREREGLEK